MSAACRQTKRKKKETHLRRTVQDATLGGYVLVSRLDRRVGEKGGIALFALPEVADNITLLDHAKDEEHEWSWHVLHADVGPILLCIWYRPPNRGEVSSISAFAGEWLHLRDAFVGTLIVGDLNVHHTHWLKFSNSVSVEGTSLFRFCRENGFKQLVKKPTHEDGHLLDLALTDMMEIHKTELLPKVADHNVLRVTMNLAVASVELRSREVFDFKKAAWERICEDLVSLDWSWISASNVDLAAGRFTDTVLSVLDAHVPTKTIFDHAPLHPWFNDRCRQLVTEKRAVEGTSDFKEAAEKCSRGIFDEYCKYIKDTKRKIAKLPRGSKQWWRKSSELMDKSLVASGVPALKDGEQWILGAKEKADLLERTFSAKCALPPLVVNEYSALPLPNVARGWLRVRIRQVEAKLKTIKEDSATGPDLLAAKVLRQCASGLALPLVLLTRLILKERRWPQLWTYHWICAIHKKKSVYVPLHYRGVHLTAQASKAIERVLRDLFLPKLVLKAFGECQFAYTPKRGARDAVAVYVLSWLKDINAGKKVGVYCSDVSGAFDRVSARRLLHKLSCHGLNADMMGVIESWLRNRQSFVVVSGQRSSGAELSNMVYQGTVWGPVLWNVFVGDVALVFESAGFSVVIYADDINAYKAYNRELGNDLVFADLKCRQRELHRWGAANQVAFDSGKESFTILSTTHAEGESFKVLGLDFDAKLSMRHCAHVCATEAGWRYRTLLRTKRFYNDTELVTLFKAHVLSYVEYRTPGIYHAATSVLDPVDRVLSSFLRQICVSETEALTNFALAPLSARRDMAMLGVIHRALLGQGPKQLRAFFRYSEVDLRRSSRIAKHNRQIDCEFGARPLDMVKRSAFGLCRVYNLLPHDIVESRSVSVFQSRLQDLLRSRMLDGQRGWQQLFSPRWAVQDHPLSK